MQHASDNWNVANFVVILSVIILFKIVTAQKGMKTPFAACIGLFTVILLAFTVRAHWWGASIGILIASAFLLFKILTSRSDRIPTIRRIAGLNAIDEAVGRATEMGRPVLMIPGIGQLDIPALQGLNIFGYIARSVAAFGNRTILAVADPPLAGVGEEVIRDAYAAGGRPELFNPDDVRFISDRQFAFASGVAGLIEREKVAASFLMGAFFAESLIITEVAQRTGTIQIAATNQFTQLPFFVATCDYVLLGDEFYAASAYLSRNPTLLGSIVGQDYAKLLILVVIVLGVIATGYMELVHTGAIHDSSATDSLTKVADYFLKMFR